MSNNAISYAGQEALVTAINDLPAAPDMFAPATREPFTIYDLNGHRLPDGQMPNIPGIYIRGGKKVVVK